MQCEELRHDLPEWRQGRLPPDRRPALEQHLSACAECQRWEREDRAIARLLAEQFLRYPAPAHLRRQIRAGLLVPRSSWWLAPASAAVATAMLMVLVLLPVLPRSSRTDQIQPLVRAALSQHARSVLWGEPRPEAVPVELPRLVRETQIGLARVFEGDDEVRLVRVEPVVMEGRWGLALSYQDRDDHTITYLVLSGRGLSVPDRNRVQIDRFRPMLARVNGFSVFVWKQGPLAMLLISDLVSESDLSRFRDYFLRIRLRTEALPVQ